MNSEIGSLTNAEQIKNVEILEHDLSLAAYHLQDFMRVSANVLGEIVDSCIPNLDAKNSAFRVVLRDYSEIQSVIPSILSNGSDYENITDGIPMSLGNPNRSSTFLVPESIRTRILQNPRLLMQNPEISDFANEFDNKSALLMIYDNSDGGIKQINGSERCSVANLAERLSHIIVINFSY